MHLENYCSKCGHRILPPDSFCKGCGCKTSYVGSNDFDVLTLPIHNIGFFNLGIDFSPYIKYEGDFEYNICSCGHIININDEFCPMCGNKRNKGIFSKFIKNKQNSFSIDNILCECGEINSRDNVYCEMCGRQLKEDPVSFDNYSNFNLEFNDSIFCFCGEENDNFSQFCRNCGLPLKNYGSLKEVSFLCCCSTINDITSDFCVNCGASFKKQDTKVICVCGHKNNKSLKFCEECERPLNPKKVIKTRIICSCGEILDWNSEFCHNCGRSIKKRIMYKNSINDTFQTLKSMFR